MFLRERSTAMRAKAFSLILMLFLLVLTTAMAAGGGFERAPRVDKSFAVTSPMSPATRSRERSSAGRGGSISSGSIGMASVYGPL